jgi:opacity protein-like surface antigen
VTRAVAVVALVLLIPAASLAQALPPRRAATSDPGFTIRGFGDAGVTTFTAAQSFKAILGKPSGPVFGGGVEIGLPKHMFVSVAASRFRRTGHRVFVFEGEVFNLDEPATITMTPFEVNLGYRYTRLVHIVPYGGAGASWHKYEETSGHSTDADDVHATFKGFQVLGGVEIPLKGWIALAAEAQWASVPKALGNDSTSVSTVYNEHNLGGSTFRVKIVVGR